MNSCPLLALSPDVLAEVTFYLPSSTILQLWFCGDSRFNSRLATGGVQDMRHDFSTQKNVHAAKWPPLLNWMRQLRQISVGCWSGIKFGVLLYQAQLWKLTPVLEKLELDFASAEQSFILDSAHNDADPLHLLVQEIEDEQGNVKTTTMIRVNTLFTKLRTLKICGVSALPSLFFEHLPQTLTTLSVPWNYNITDSTIALLPPHLTHLDIAKAKKITDASIPLLPRSLLHLDLTSASLITTDCLKNLPPQLTFLNVASVEGWNDMAVALLPRTILDLDMRNASTVTDKCCQHLPKDLRSLNINENRTLTDDFALHLPRSLRRLFLFRCSRLTTRCVPDLPPDLEVLCIPNCEDVRNAYFALRSMSPAM